MSIKFFSFTLGEEPITESIFDSYDVINGKFVWKAEFKDEYINRLNDEHTTEKLKLLHANISSFDENGITTCLEVVVSIFDNVCSPILKKTKQGYSTDYCSLRNRGDNLRHNIDLVNT